MSFIEYTVKVYPNGTKYWYLNGKLHREDGPAAEWSDGTKWWYLNGELHREDGPAIEWSNGTKYWYLNGECLSEEKFNKRTNPEPDSCDGKVVEIDGKKYKLTHLGELE
jgi:antitoxin component YwqK of YwqJK toxin-antitoxin module